jgi:light-regulated signal transduction histidine kinase (bacteriophytochrome)
MRDPFNGVALCYPSARTFVRFGVGKPRHIQGGQNHQGQLLALALADEAQQQLTHERVALHDVVRDVLMRFMPRADAQHVDLGAVGIDHPVWVQANRALLEGVLNNLLDNALRYGAAPSGESCITVSVDDAPQAVVLSVVDNGPGVSQAQCQKLSRRWVQGSAGEALKEGSGLGLARVFDFRQRDDPCKIAPLLKASRLCFYESGCWRAFIRPSVS